MCFCGRYIRSMRWRMSGRDSRAVAISRVPVEMEAAIDRRAVAGVQLRRALLLIVPWGEQLGRQHLRQERLLAGGAEDHPGAGPGGAVDLAHSAAICARLIQSWASSRT